METIYRRTPPPPTRITAVRTKWMAANMNAILYDTLFLLYLLDMHIVERIPENAVNVVKKPKMHKGIVIEDVIANAQANGGVYIPGN